MLSTLPETSLVVAPEVSTVLVVTFSFVTGRPLVLRDLSEQAKAIMRADPIGGEEDLHVHGDVLGAGDTVELARDEVSAWPVPK